MTKRDPKKHPYKLSPRTRKRMSEAHKGKKHSEETKAKIRAARRERQELIDAGLLPRYTHSPEVKKKLKKLAKGRKPSKKAIRAAANARRDRGYERRLRKAMQDGTLN